MMKAFARINPASQQIKMLEVPVPEMNSDEVLIQVKSFGVGIHDRYFIPGNARFPYVIGSEGAGIIEKTGSQVQNFKAGDRVVFTTILQPQGGSWAQYAVAKAGVLHLLPARLNFSQGAAVPIAGTTALECLRALPLSAGDTLFIAGASGAIGTLVIQMAAARGIRVSASASAKNHNYMRLLGAEKTVDYHDAYWQHQIIQWSGGGVTAALAIQPGTGIQSIKAVKANGAVITVSGDSAQVVPERNIAVQQIQHHAETAKQIEQLLQNIADGVLKITIEKEYDFEDALLALQKTETRHAKGKLVVQL